MKTFLEINYNSKQEVLQLFHDIAVPHEACICKKDVFRWEHNQKKQLQFVLKGLVPSEYYLKKKNIFIDVSFEAYQARFKHYMQRHYDYISECTGHSARECSYL